MTGDSSRVNELQIPLRNLRCLTLNNLFGNRLLLFELMGDVAKTHRELSHLDLRDCIYVGGLLSFMLFYDFPSLTTLILRKCGLGSADLKRLAKAKADGKLPQLKHLDISHNYWGLKGLQSFTEVPRNTWLQLSTLNLYRAYDKDIFDDYVRPQYFPSLQELGIFSLSSRPVTDCWRHLQTLRVGMNGVNFISKAVQEGFFPALRNVCIMKTDRASELFNIPELRILAAFGIFCHSPFEFDQSPFSRDICICQQRT